jgi:nitrate reductase gamma subunit
MSDGYKNRETEAGLPEYKLLVEPLFHFSSLIIIYLHACMFISSFVSSFEVAYN